MINSQRSVSKATYAPARLPDTGGQKEPRRVLEKAAFLRRLGMTAEEYATLRGTSAGGFAVRPETVDLTARVTASARTGGLGVLAERLASTPVSELLAIGRAVQGLRANAGARDTAARTAALVAAFSAASSHVVGALHLERMEMTPVGVQHGELVHSVPMTPKETVNISHREWSVTTQTFESIVTDSFEGFSETGVAEKTDITQATENETRHSTSLDVSGSVTATVNGTAYSVTAAAATDYSDKNDVHNTVKQSIDHAVQVTRHASARTRKEHKTSFRVTSVAGAEDLAVRTLTNPNDYPIRVDYFQLIRKWQVDLIRYGLRLTYDLVIPDPGIDLIGPVLELQQLDQMLTIGTLTFDLTPSDIEPYDVNNENYYTRLAARFGATVDAGPPKAHEQISQTKALDKVGGEFRYDHIDMAVPDDYEIVGGHLIAQARLVQSNDIMQFNFDQVHQATFDLYVNVDLAQVTSPTTYLHTSGPVTFPYSWTQVDTGQVTIWLELAPTKEGIEAWRAKVWAALREAAQAQFDRGQATAKDRKTFLESQLAEFDALTLRKMEHEEVMKWVLQWLLYDNPVTANPIRDLAADWSPPPATERPGPTVALYRLVDFGKNSNGGDHFYTDSAAERDSAITDYYYHDEGVAGFVYTEQVAGTVPLYRFRDTTSGHRVYTISNAERDELNNNRDAGYVYEKVACYVYPAAVEGTVPLHRLHDTTTGDRLYTVSDQERATALANGYQDEHDACYIYPPDPARPAQDVESIEGADPGALDLPTRARVLAFGSETIEFLQNAVEWENMLFFVYPYFWDDVENWPFKRFLMHPDPVHREFLRGGAARVVLTIRPGFEDAFIRLAEGLHPGDSSPYVTLGQEIRNYAMTNYENIPPANPDRTARPLLYPLQRAAWNDMQAIIAAIEYYYETQQPNRYPDGAPGAPALPGVLKTFLLAQIQANGSQSWPATLWDNLKRVPVQGDSSYADPNTPVPAAAEFTDPWGNPYHYATSAPPPAKPLLHGDYELACWGSNNKPETDPADPLSEKITSWAEGLLVGRWYEYTPTGALDVSVDRTLGINDTLGG